MDNEDRFVDVGTNFEEEYAKAVKLLYDDVSQLLYSILLGFRSAEQRGLAPEISQFFKELNKLAEVLLEEIRDISSKSYPFMLTSLGFLTVFQRWMADFEEKHVLHVRLEWMGFTEGDRFQASIEKALFHICRYWALLSETFADAEHPVLIRIRKADYEVKLELRASYDYVTSMLRSLPLADNAAIWRELDNYHVIYRVFHHKGEDIGVDVTFQVEHGSEVVHEGGYTE